MKGVNLMSYRFEKREKKENGFSDEEMRELISQRIEKLSSKHLWELMNFIEPLYEKDILEPYLLGYEMPNPDSQEYTFLKLASKYKGNIIRTLMLKEDISRYNFQSFVEKYQLQEITTGSYIYPNSTIDAPFMFQQKYSKATIALESALYYYGYSDVIPKETIMYMPRTYNLKQIHFGEHSLVEVKDITTSETRQQLKIFYPDNDPILLMKNVKATIKQSTQMSLENGLPILITPLEQTLVDIVKPQFSVEEEVKVQAYKQYIEKNQKMLPKLQHRASIDGVLNKVNYYLERRLY